MTKATGTELQFEPVDDDPPRQVTGTYITRYIADLDYTQHIIGGVVVDPATIVLEDTDG